LKPLPDSLKNKLQDLSLLDIDNRFPDINEEQELCQHFIATHQTNQSGLLMMTQMLQKANTKKKY